MSLLPQFGSLIPSQTPQLLATNYIQWNNNGGAGAVPANFAEFAQQYLPEIYEAEVELTLPTNKIMSTFEIINLKVRNDFT